MTNFYFFMMPNELKQHPKKLQANKLRSFYS